MDAMDVDDVNGGNTEMAQDNNNSEIGLDELNNQESNEEKKDDELIDELNGDVKNLNKKLSTSISKRKARKFKTNSSSTNESDHEVNKTRSSKRKLSDFNQLTSDDSQDFYGFDKTFYEPVKNSIEIIEKLIADADAEVTDSLPAKRLKRSLSKGPRKNIELKPIINDDNQEKTNILDPNDIKTHLDVSVEPVGDENKSEIDSDMDDTKSTSSSLINKSKNTINSTKQKIDIKHPMFKLPFKYGWKREIIKEPYRTVEAYYYTPKGKKVTSYKEVCKNLKDYDDLKSKNFTFEKDVIGMNNPKLENIIFRKNTCISPRKKSLVKTTLQTPINRRTTPAKRELESTSPPKEPEVGSQWIKSPTATKRSQMAEKNSSFKSKRLVKKKSTAVEVDQREYIMAAACAGYNALSRVFQYLKVQELLRAARVCKMWRDLASQPSLWKIVRMKNSQVTDWDGLANSLIRHETQHLDLRKMVGETNENIWNKFVPAMSRVKSLVKLVLCRSPVNVVEDVIKNFQQLEAFSATSIANTGNSKSISLENLSNLTNLKELTLKAANCLSIADDLTPLQNLTQLTYLSLTSINGLGMKKIEVLANLVNLESLELGECSELQAEFGTSVLICLTKLERLRLEKGQGTCCTFDILTGVAQMKNLQQLELINFDVKNGFDKHLAECKNIKRLLIIPTYISQSATSNNMVLGGVTELSNNLTYFIWGVTLELLKVTELFIDQCNQMKKQGFGESIPVLKPVPSLKLIETVDENNPVQEEEKQLNPNSPQVDILPLPKLQKLLLTALPKTRVKILKIPFHTTWRQSISESTSATPAASTTTITSKTTTTHSTTATTTTTTTTTTTKPASS